MFDDMAAVEDVHFWHRARNALIVWALTRYFPAAASMLEAGCGNGQVLRAVARARPGLRLAASEVFLEGLETAARSLSGAEFVRADIRDLPFDAEFDVVGAFDVLEHVDRHEDAMRCLVRSARPGGGILITVPQHQWLWSEVDAYSGHCRRYSRGSLRRLMEDAGLDVLRMTSFVTLLLPAMVASRLTQRRAFAPGAEAHPGSLVSGVASGVMGMERALIRAGVSMPLGGSLLAVARRPATAA